MSKSNAKPVALALCTALGGLALSASAFGMDQLSSGYMAAGAAVAGDKAGEEGKCGEGKCGIDKIDADKDGKVSATEFSAAHPDKADRFAAMDANGDGFVDKAEHEAHKAASKGDVEKAGMEGKCGEGKCGGTA